MAIQSFFHLPKGFPMQAEHELFVADLLAAWNSHDARRVACFYAAGYEGIDIGQVAPLRGPVDVQDYFERFYAAFPNVKLTVDSLLADGDRCTIAWTANGTHLGKLMNIPPSGKSINVRGVTLLTLANHQITHSLTIWDMAGLLRTIGLLPRLAR
jgi:steroid delta-isomerase-like uncharacterized protein